MLQSNRKFMNALPLLVAAAFFSAGNVTAADAPLSATAVSDKFPAAYASLPKKKGGACGFDQSKIVSDLRLISGWGIISAKDGAVPEAIVVGIISADGEKFVTTTKQKRDDVAKYFKNPGLLESGFNALVSKTDGPMRAKVNIYQVYQGSVYACAQSGAI